MVKLGLLFCIQLLFVSFLPSSSVPIFVHMSSQDIIGGRRMLGGRTGFSPPAPAANVVKHHFPPEDGRWIGSPPPAI